MRIGRGVILLIAASLIPACSKDKQNPKPPSTIANAPTGLTATKRSTARIDLTWVDNSNNEFEFRIERSDDGGTTYSQVGSALKESQSWTDYGLLPNKLYFYRVTAWNSEGNSPFAGPASAQTDPLTWTSTPGGPGIRADHTAIFDVQGQRMILFGGQDDFFTYYNDLWELDLSDTTANTAPSDHWTLLNPGTAPNTPSARFGHSAVYDGQNRRMIVFGGQDGTVPPANSYQNDVYVLALGTLVWTKQTPTGTPPTPRLGHSAVYDSVNQRMIVFGGNDAAGEKADTFFLSLPAGGTFAWSAGPSGPKKRTEHTAIYDSAHQQMIIYGGLDHLTLPDGTDLNSETWALNLSGTSVWTQPFFGAPFFRFGHTAVNDSANQRLMMFGGGTTFTATPAVVNELWGLGLEPGATWTFLSPSAGTPPVARYGHSAVYDSVKARMVIFGGYDNSLFPAYQDTWINDF